MANKCKECGCKCTQCMENDQKHNDVHLHAEIENLRQRLLERDNHIVTMETHFLNEADKFPNGELASIKEEMLIWQDKYARLYEAHKRIQKVNQNLEDKLLRIVDKCETEKGAFAKDIATLSHRLADANYTIHRLTQDNDKYRNDVNLAIQLLQCKPSNFVGQKYDMLPPEVQAKVRSYIAQKTRTNEDTSNNDVKSITVPISTFPPTAMVYNVTKANTEKPENDTDDESKPPVDVVSASIMAKILEDREKERIFGKHCDTCTCSKSILKVDMETQTSTDIPINEYSVQNMENVTKGLDYANGSEKSCRLNGQLNYHMGISLDSSKTKIQSAECSTKRLTKNTDISKVSSRGNISSTRGYIPLKNSLRNQYTTDDSSQTSQQNSYKYDRKSSKDLRNLENYSTTWKEQEDIINERLWKSTWTKNHFLSKDEIPEKTSRSFSEITKIEVINDRVWRNNRSRNEEASKSQLTLVEVKSADEISPQCIGQTEATTSPSFSSESIVISTSDPSSISSDASKSVNNKDYNTSSSKQDKPLGPRNCLMRVKPGSKNILLDNVDTYQTVLYTTGNDRPNTILVHSVKPRLERSASLSSEENSSILSHDNTQLQRVAEWVESSVHVDDSLKFASELTTCDKQNLFCAKSEDKSLTDSCAKSSELIEKDECGILNDLTIDRDKDLITFEASSDEGKESKAALEREKSSTEYEVKITKEMEETYLKLAASLDSISLNLTSSTGPDLTIEKYRKDKRFNNQKSKTGSTA